MKKYKKNRVHSTSTASTNNKITKTVDIPPTNINVQEVPRSLKEFIKLKELSKNIGYSCKKGNRSDISGKRKFQEPKSSKKTDINLNFKNKTTSGETYVHNNISSNNLQSNSDFIEIEPKKNINIKKKRKLKLMKLKLKRKLKKNRNDDIDLEHFARDEIKFGEVVHRPPQMLVLPRKVTKMNYSNRPGRKDDLLLKSILKRSHENHSKFYKNN